MTERYISPAVAADKLRLTRMGVQNMCRRGDIKSIKVFTKNKFYWAIPEEEIEKLIRGHVFTESENRK